MFQDESVSDKIITLPFAAATRSASAPALGHFGELFGGSPPMQEVYRRIAKVAPTMATVLITGESGSGKEVVAHTIHGRSERAKFPFVAVNCGAIPGTLIEAELFGYEKGAFTGAVRMHRGCFERAEGGTLFLDEITEMAPEMQVRLLRVLETGLYSRVGGEQELRASVRVIAATNQDPRQAVHDGHLREDLMYRLAVFPIVLPALRERDGDAELLAEHFLRQMNEADGTRKAFSRRAVAALRVVSLAGKRPRVEKCRPAGMHHVRRSGRARFRRPRMSGAGGQLPSRAGRNAAGRNRAPGHLCDARPLRRQQTPLRRDAGRQPQDALQPTGGISIGAGSHDYIVDGNRHSLQ